MITTHPLASTVVSARFQDDHLVPSVIGNRLARLHKGALIDILCDCLELQEIDTLAKLNEFIEPRLKLRQ